MDVLRLGGVMAKYYVEIEREVSLEVEAEDYEQAEEEAMSKFIANPNEQLLLNRVVVATRVEE
tara:strand:- start:206 stop:394 length:189 start_codon:yes stop_codon:yes gene_type:complete